MDTATPAQSSKWGRASCLVWFAIAALCLKTCTFDGVARQREIRTWDTCQATIESSEVNWGGPESDYELSLEFSVDFGDEARTYKSFRHSGKKGALTRLAREQYAPGAVIEVQINPANRREFAFLASEAGHRWMGIAGAVFFGLIGLSVLRGRKDIPPPPRPPDDHGVRPATP